MNLQNVSIIDLSHPVTSDMPHWPGDPKTQITPHTSWQQDGYFMQNLFIAEHAGTHIGAPRHFSADGASIDSLAPHQLIVNAVKISIRQQCAVDAGYCVQIKDIDEWEAAHGTIPHESVVLVETGWDTFWSAPDSYIQTDAKHLVFPGVSLDAAEILIQRKIVGIGIDSPGVDGGQNTIFSVNRRFSDHGIYHLENLTRLDQLQPTRAVLFVGALAIQDGSGSPCRVFAIQD